MGLFIRTDTIDKIVQRRVAIRFHTATKSGYINHQIRFNHNHFRHHYMLCHIKTTQEAIQLHPLFQQTGSLFCLLVYMIIHKPDIPTLRRNHMQELFVLQL